MPRDRAGDLVDDVLAQLRQEVPDARADRLLALEVRLRDRFGGHRVYCRRTAATGDEKARQVPPPGLA